jgi:acetyltransferase-like isoleucine patch superfamily enzyme
MKIPLYEEFVRFGSEKHILKSARNRMWQWVARSGPGGNTFRVTLHRWRGVGLGKEVWIGYDVIIETAYPELISIGDYSMINMRSTIIGHFKDQFEVGNDGLSVRIGNDVFIGAGVIVLPNVTIGDGSVVTAGSVVTQSVPPMTLVQGNPAEAVARCGVPLTRDTTLKDFTRRLLPL